MADGSNGIAFLATVLNKMTQMFSEISFIYLNTMINKNSTELTPQYSINSLFQNQKKDIRKEYIEHKNQVDLETKCKNKKAHLSQSQKGKQVDEQEQTRKNVYILPPNPPPSSYLLFFKDHRQKIAEEYPHFSTTQLNKIASQCWKELSDQEKKPYHQKFNELKQKYYQDMKIYNQRRLLFLGKSNKPSKSQKSKNKKKSQKEQKKHEKKQAQKLPTIESDSDFGSELMI